jgi:predicted transcriptional regulator
MSSALIAASSDLLSLTVTIVSAHLAHHNVSMDEVKPLMESVHATLHALKQGTPTNQSAATAAQKLTQSSEKRMPAVSVRKSVHPDYLICLEDGKKLKMLKRHLRTVYGLTPEQYRKRWGLPSDYPMVASRYAEKRSSLARQSGLGQQKTGKGKKA